MDINDILTLAKAGFTAQQITAIIQAPAPTPAPAPAPAVDPVLAAIQQLTGALQANAIINANMPQNTQKTEDILAAIINPPTTAKK